MELRQLAYFVAVAEELHFGRAAAKVGITQPSLTQQIKRLEKELDVLLLNRNSHAAELTAAGQLFLDKAQATIRRADDATATVKRCRGTGRARPTGIVRIGHSCPAEIRVLPGALRRFWRVQPRARVRLAELWTGQQLDAVLAGELDVGFVLGPVSHPGLRARTLLREKFAVLLPERHRLTVPPRVEFADVASEPLVWFPRELSPALYDRFSCAAVDADLPLNICYEAWHPRAMRLLVTTQHALAIVTSACASSIRDAGLVSRPLAGVPDGEDLSVVWRASEQHQLVSAFLEAVGQSAGPQGPPGPHSEPVLEG